VIVLSSYVRFVTAKYSTIRDDHGIIEQQCILDGLLTTVTSENNSMFNYEQYHIIYCQNKYYTIQYKIFTIIVIKSSQVINCKNI